MKGDRKNGTMMPTRSADAIGTSVRTTIQASTIPSPAARSVLEIATCNVLKNARM